MRKTTQKICAIATAMAVALASYAGYPLNNQQAKAAGTAAVSDNIHRESYRWQSAINDTIAKPVTSYLYEGDADTLIRVESIGSSIVVEQYEKSDYSFQSGITIPKELSIFGGFYAGKEYNYFVFGQSNPDESDACEVVRIVQYTKDWVRVASDSVYGGNTTIPFEAGSLRMCEVNDILYVRTCHQMYRSDDGCNHQANMTLCYNSFTKTITDDSNTIVGGNGYVSHSFNQFIEVDGDDLVTVDHGDAYPRAIVLMRYQDVAGSEKFNQREEEVNLLTFPGDIGDNYTGAALGGLKVSSTNYLTAYNTVDQELFYGWVRNVYLASTDKDDMTVQTTQFTSFTATGKESAGAPVLVKLSENEFVLMWAVYDADEVTVVNGNPGTRTIQYVKLDGEGKPLGEVNTVEGDLSDCHPLVLGNEIVWYVTDNSAPVFYCLNADTGVLSSTYKEEAVPTVTSTPSGTCPLSTPQPSGEPVVSGDNTGSSKTMNTAKQNTEKSASTTISVPKVSGLKVKNKKKRKLKCTWKKVKNATYYTVQIARNRSFTKQKKSYTVTGTSYTHYYLKKKKTYYVRVRALRYEDGNYVYGSWSSVKKAKVKK